MPKFFIDFEDNILDLKQFVTAKKKIYYDTDSDKMVFAIIINDGLNEVFNTRYEWKYETENQLEFKWKAFKDKIANIDWIVVL